MQSTEKEREQILKKFFDKKDWESIEIVCTEWISEDSSNPFTFYNRGIARGNVGKLYEAKKDLENSLRLKPDLDQAKELLKQININILFWNKVEGAQQRNSLSPQRRQIWDYFFYNHYDSVGEDVESEIIQGEIKILNYVFDMDQGISKLSSEMNEKIKSVILKDRISPFLLVIGALLVSFYLFSVNVKLTYINYQMIKHLHYLGALLILLAVINRVKQKIAVKKEHQKIKSKYKDKIDQLKKNFEKAINEIRNANEQRNALLKKLNSMKPKNTLSGEQIDKLLEESQERLWNFALHSLSLDQENLIRLPDKVVAIFKNSQHKFDDSNWQQKKLTLMEPACFQDNFWELVGCFGNIPLRFGYISRIDNNDGRLRYSCNYFQFIFLAKQHVAIYGLYYDLISDRIINEEITEFYYRYVVGVKMEQITSNNKNLKAPSYLQNQKIIQFQFILANGKDISINLIENTDLIEDIKNREYEKKKERKQKSIDEQEERLKDLDRSIHGDLFMETQDKIKKLKREIVQLDQEHNIELSKRKKPKTLSSVCEEIENKRVLHDSFSKTVVKAISTSLKTICNAIDASSESEIT